MELVLEQSREIGDAQSLWPSLIASARLARRRGLSGDATQLLGEVVDAIAVSESAGDPQEWHVELILALDAIGRGADAKEVAARLPEGPWRDACQATSERDYVAAAEVLAAMGEKPLQAELRLLAARSLAANGKLAEAESQLALARAFWHSVGATTYLSEADEVLAAAS